MLGTFVHNVLGVSGYKVMQYISQTVRFLLIVLKV